MNLTAQTTFIPGQIAIDPLPGVALDAYMRDGMNTDMNTMQRAHVLIALTIGLLFKRMTPANVTQVILSRTKAFTSVYGSYPATNTAARIANAFIGTCNDTTSFLGSLKALQQRVFMTILRYVQDPANPLQGISKICMRYCEYYNMTHIKLISTYLVTLDHPILLMRCVRPELNNFIKFVDEYAKLGPLAPFCRLLSNITIDMLGNSQNFIHLTAIAAQVAVRIDARFQYYTPPNVSVVGNVVNVAMNLHDVWARSAQGNRRLSEYTVLLKSKIDPTEYDTLHDMGGVIGNIIV